MSYALTFSGKPKADKNKYLYYGQVQMDDDVGLIVPVTALVKWITTNQDGTDNSDLDIKVNNSIVDTLSVTNRDHVFTPDINVLTGDLITVFNQNDNDLDDFSMTLYFLEPVPLPVATGLQVGDHVDVTMVTGFLNDYVVLALPTILDDYWVLAPADNLLEITEVGPSMIAMVKRP